MSNEEALCKEAGSSDLSSSAATDNTVELRLPPKAEYIPVLRATLGVIAGTMPFNYDGIVQLRVAVSEAFAMAIRHIQQAGGHLESVVLGVRFAGDAARLEIVMSDPEASAAAAEAPDETESRAVIESLVDSAEFGAEVGGQSVIRLVKHR